MSKRAPLVGVDEYDDPAVANLQACVNDAIEMQNVLARHCDGSVNLDCKMLTGPGPVSVTRALLRRR